MSRLLAAKCLQHLSVTMRSCSQANLVESFRSGFNYDAQLYLIGAEIEMDAEQFGKAGERLDEWLEKIKQVKPTDRPDSEPFGMVT